MWKLRRLIATHMLWEDYKMSVRKQTRKSGRNQKITLKCHSFSSFCPVEVIFTKFKSRASTSNWYDFTTANRDCLWDIRVQNFQELSISGLKHNCLKADFSLYTKGESHTLSRSFWSAGIDRIINPESALKMRYNL